MGGKEPNWFFARHRKLGPEYHNLLIDPGIVRGGGMDHVLMSPELLPHVDWYRPAHDGPEVSDHRPTSIMLTGLRRASDATELSGTQVLDSIMGSASWDAFAVSEWVDGSLQALKEREEDRLQTEAQSTTVQVAPLCKCGLRAAKKRVKKIDSVYRGQEFFGCPKRYGCNFWQLVNEGVPQEELQEWLDVATTPLDSFVPPPDALKVLDSAAPPIGDAKVEDAKRHLTGVSWSKEGWLGRCASGSDATQSYVLRIELDRNAIRAAYCSCPVKTRSSGQKQCKHIWALAEKVNGLIEAM